VVEAAIAAVIAAVSRERFMNNPFYSGFIY
jgi:hypothetical protein